MLHQRKHLANHRSARPLILDLSQEKIDFEPIDPMEIVRTRMKERDTDGDGKTMEERIRDTLAKNIGKDNFHLNTAYAVRQPNFDFQVEKQMGWNANNRYTIFVHPENKRINAMLGIDMDIMSYNGCSVGKPIHLGRISEEFYSLIAKSIDSNEMITFWNEEENRLVFRRLMVYLDQTTTVFDPDVGFVSTDNVIRFRPQCVDDSMNIAADVPELQIKSMRNKVTKETNGCEINDKPGRRAMVDNDSFVQIKLNGSGRHTFRIKGIVPESKDMWLTLYMECMKLDPEDLEILKSKLPTMATPRPLAPL